LPFAIIPRRLSFTAYYTISSAVSPLIWHVHVQPPTVSVAAHAPSAAAAATTNSTVSFFTLPPVQIPLVTLHTGNLTPGIAAVLPTPQSNIKVVAKAHANVKRGILD
jgi:hypothetical protein